MRIATWNINGLQARTPNLLAWLLERQPDVIGLQELKTSKLGPLGRFEELGYHVLSTAEVALLSIDPIADGAEPTGDGRSVAGTVNGIRVVNLYAPNGTKARTPAHERKVQWLRDFTSVVSSQASLADDTAVIGDVNVARAPIDVWAPQNYRERNLFTSAERNAFESIIAGNELVDVVRTAHSGPGVYSWFNYAHRAFERNRGWRLDYLLTSPGLAKRVTHAVIDVEERARARTSDHAPLWIDLA